MAMAMGVWPCVAVSGLAMASQGCLSMSTSKSTSRRFSKKHSTRVGIKSMEDAAMQVAEDDGPSSFTLGVSENAVPEHLVILVNGIGGSAENWRFAAEQFKQKLADKVVVHCSASNSRFKTFNGVDIMGNRLAEEVMNVIKDTPGVTKISFLSHSLGGLIARYAIGQLFAPPGRQSLLQERSSSSFQNGETSARDGETSARNGETSAGDSEAGGSGRERNKAPLNTHPWATMAGLEPVNFITVATPNLGSRGNQHLPFLFGITLFEKVAPFVSHWFVGRTGRHLFLADGDKTQQPLLQRMVTDCVEGRFLSALRSFKQRTAYANICQDHMVGWQTASIRRESELPEAVHEGIDPKYPHIVREEEIPAVVMDSSDDGVSQTLEESMVAGLQQVPWRRVDVSFMKAKVKYQAHNLIQVKTVRTHLEGEDVIHHILDKHF